MFDSVFDYSVLFCSDTGIAFQIFQSHYSIQQSSGSKKIIHQTAPFLSSYRKREAFYNHRHRGISGLYIWFSRWQDVHAPCPCCMFLPRAHVNVACPCMLHFHAVCLCCMPMSMLHFMSYPGSPVLAALSVKSGHGGPVLEVWSWKSFPGSIILPVLFCLSSSPCHVCPSCFACLVLPDLFCLSFSACPFYLSCSACPVLYVLFCQSCSACLVLPVLFCFSCSA